jgi:single-stranded DNA-binding protein
LAETCAENLQKGSAVLVEGELQSRSLRGEDGRNRNIVEIKASRVQFLNKREEAAINGTEPPSAERTESAPAQPKEKTEQAVEELEENNPLKGKFDFGFQELEL